MSEEIISASNKLIVEWAQEIIKAYKLSKGSSATDLTNCIIKYFKEKLPDFDIGVYEINKPTIKFDLR
jgi:hypothetical protein